MKNRNRFNLDVGYFEKNLKVILRDLENYTPEDFARALARLSLTAEESIIYYEEGSKTNERS